MIELGQEVRDVLTGASGTVIARSEYLHGCVRVSVQPREVKDGMPGEWFTVDEPQLEIVADTPAPRPKQRGGPRPDVPRARDVSR